MDDTSVRSSSEKMRGPIGGNVPPLFFPESLACQAQFSTVQRSMGNTTIDEELLGSTAEELMSPSQSVENTWPVEEGEKDEQTTSLETLDHTKNRFVVGAPTSLVQGMTRSEHVDVNFGTKATPLPRPTDDVGFEDTLFVPVTHERDVTMGDRVGTWMTATLRKIGIFSEPQRADNIRIRMNSGDDYIPTEERVAYRLLVEGGADLKYRLISSNVGMDAIVCCGVSIEVCPPPPFSPPVRLSTMCWGRVSVVSTLTVCTLPSLFSEIVAGVVHGGADDSRRRRTQGRVGTSAPYGPASASHIRSQPRRRMHTVTRCSSVPSKLEQSGGCVGTHPSRSDHHVRRYALPAS